VVLSKTDLRVGLVILTVIAAGFLTSVVIGAPPTNKSTGFKEKVTSHDYGNLVLSYSPSVSATDVALPFYPKATQTRGWRYSATDQKGKPAGFLAQIYFTTTATPAQVVEFYKKQLGEKLRIETEAKSKTTHFFGKQGEDTVVIRVFVARTGEPKMKPGATGIELSRASKVLAKELTPDGNESPLPRHPRRSTEGLEEV
jgi:hypothetical protein